MIVATDKERKREKRCSVILICEEVIFCKKRKKRKKWQDRHLKSSFAPFVSFFSVVAFA